MIHDDLLGLPCQELEDKDFECDFEEFVRIYERTTRILVP